MAGPSFAPGIAAMRFSFVPLPAAWMAGLLLVQGAAAGLAWTALHRNAEALARLRDGAVEPAAARSAEEAGTLLHGSMLALGLSGVLAIGAWAARIRLVRRPAERGPLVRLPVAAARARGAPAVPRPAAPATERRRHARQPLDRGGLLELERRRATAVVLLDLSEGGAGVAWRGSPPPAGTAGRLIVDTAALAVRVARTADGRLGLAFVAQGPETAESVRRIMAGTGLVRAA